MDRETQELKDLHEALAGLEPDFAIEMFRNAESGEHSYKVRVMRVDGRNCIGTQDFDPNRVNVSVVNGVIKSIISIG